MPSLSVMQIKLLSIPKKPWQVINYQLYNKSLDDSQVFPAPPHWPCSNLHLVLSALTAWAVPPENFRTLPYLQSLSWSTGWDVRLLRGRALPPWPSWAAAAAELEERCMTMTTTMTRTYRRPRTEADTAKDLHFSQGSMRTPPYHRPGNFLKINQTPWKALIVVF